MGKILRYTIKNSQSVFVFLAVIFLFTGESAGKDVTLAWDQDSRAAGYYVYYKQGEGGGRILANYNGKDASEGVSPIKMALSLDESPDPNIVEFTLHGLDDNEKYVFVVTAYDDKDLESSGSREIQVLGSNDILAPYNLHYNVGWRITAGDLQGFTVFSHASNMIIPTLGSSDAIPALGGTISGVQGVGIALNLQPSGTQFPSPVTLLIPSPGYRDVSALDLYYYDDNRGQWFLAHDADDDPGVVQPDAVGWLVSGSRVNHNNGNPSTIEIQVKHFSGVQAATLASASGGSVVAGGGGCFISAITKRRQ
jgi:hypothetical protein